MIQFSSIQFSSVAQSYPILCNPMDCSMPGCPVHHQLLEFTQTDINWVGDAIKQSHLLSSPSPPAFNFAQNQGLFICQFFASGGQSIGVSASTSFLPMNIQDWFPLGWTGWISLQFKRLSRVFSSTTVQKHQFFSAQLSLCVQLSYPYMTTGYSQGNLGNTRKYQSCAFSATNMLNCDDLWI